MAAPAQQLNDLSLDHYSQRETFVNASAEVAGQMWAEVNPNDIVNSWAAQVPELTAVVSGAQFGAARPADSYVSAALGAQDVADEAVSAIDPAAFAGVSAEGGPLISLLTHPAFITLASISDGVDISRAMGMGRSNLDMIVRTEVADAGRLADQVALTAHRSASGYTRLAVGNSCARCLVLAGKEYEWNAGFLRHPRCDCVHVPSGRRKARKAKSPQQIYDRMTAAQRTRAGFTKADQRAIAEGADLNQVVNAQRGMYVPGAGSRRVRRPDGTTVEGTTRRSIAGRRLKGSPRLTTDEIYRIVGNDREEALRLLYRNGYLLDPPVRLPTPAQRVDELFGDVHARFDALGLPPVRVGGVGPARGSLNSMTVPQLRALAKERGVTIPPKSLKADIVRLLDEAPAASSIAERAPVFNLRRAMDEGRISDAEIADIRERIRVDRPPLLIGRELEEGMLARVSEDPVLRRFYTEHRDIFNHLVQEERIPREWVTLWGTPRIAEMQRKATRAIQRAVAPENPIVIRRATEENLRRALADGRLKTQFETGTSRGFLDTDLRADFEQMTFGLPTDLPAAQRPVYGYVAVGGLEKDAGERLMQFGEIRIVLRPQVRRRVTVSVGDSLDKRKEMFPMRIDEADWHAVRPVLADARIDSKAFRDAHYVEAQIHGGVTVDDIAEVVFRATPDPETIAALERAGVAWRVEGEATRTVTQSTARQTLIDKRRAVADFNADTLEALLDAQVDTDVLVRRIQQSAARNGIPKRTVDSLITAARSGDPAKVEAAVARISRTAKVQPLARSTDIVAYDPKTMQALERAQPGQKVRVVRPGHSADVNGERVQLSKSVVEVLTPAEIRDIEARALRQAARERNRLIEARTGTARLLAEVDELISKGASKATIAQRLDVKLVEPEQIFAGADPDIVKALRDALATGDMAKLKTAITRAGTKAKIKPISRAGAKAKYDPKTMEPFAGDIPAGAQVTVVTRGSTLTLPDGKVLQLTKARVQPVAKAVAAPSPFPRPGVDALPTAPRVPAPTTAAKATNPRYGSTQSGPTYRAAGKAGQRYDPSMGPLPSGAFEENCTNVVMAWEMRMRGYRVTARPLEVLDRHGYAAGRTFAEYDQLLRAAWRAPGGGPLPSTRTFASQFWMTNSELQSLVSTWPEGARGLVHAGRHTFNLVKKNGRMEFIEAQSGGLSGSVTAKYLKKFGSDDRGAWKVVRTDDLEPSDGILEAVEAGS